MQIAGRGAKWTWSHRRCRECFYTFLPPAFFREKKRSKVPFVPQSQSFLPLMASSTIYCIVVSSRETEHRHKYPHNRAVFEVKPLLYSAHFINFPPIMDQIDCWNLSSSKHQGYMAGAPESGRKSKHADGRLMHRGPFAGVYLMKAVPPPPPPQPPEYVFTRKSTNNQFGSTDKMRTELGLASTAPLLLEDVSLFH